MSLARMAKTKKNRRGMAEKAATKPKSAVKRLNPFDVRFVKNPKQTVIGRKVKKDVGWEVRIANKLQSRDMS